MIVYILRFFLFILFFSYIDCSKKFKKDDLELNLQQINTKTSWEKLSQKDVDYAKTILNFVFNPQISKTDKQQQKNLYDAVTLSNINCLLYCIHHIILDCFSKKNTHTPSLTYFTTDLMEKALSISTDLMEKAIATSTSESRSRIINWAMLLGTLVGIFEIVYIVYAQNSCKDEKNL